MQPEELGQTSIICMWVKQKSGGKESLLFCLKQSQSDDFVWFGLFSEWVSLLRKKYSNREIKIIFGLAAEKIV